MNTLHLMLSKKTIPKGFNNRTELKQMKSFSGFGLINGLFNQRDWTMRQILRQVQKLNKMFNNQ